MAMAALTMNAMRQTGAWPPIAVFSVNVFSATVTIFRRECVELLFCRVVFRLLRARVEDVEAAVRLRRQLEVISGVRPIRIGDEFVRYIMCGSAFFGIVQLPKIFKARRFLDG